MIAGPPPFACNLCGALGRPHSTIGHNSSVPHFRSAPPVTDIPQSIAVNRIDPSQPAVTRRHTVFPAAPASASCITRSGRVFAVPAQNRPVRDNPSQRRPKGECKTVSITKTTREKPHINSGFSLCWHPLAHPLFRNTWRLV